VRDHIKYLESEKVFELWNQYITDKSLELDASSLMAAIKEVRESENSQVFSGGSPRAYTSQICKGLMVIVAACMATGLVLGVAAMTMSIDTFFRCEISMKSHVTGVFAKMAGVPTICEVQEKTATALKNWLYGISGIASLQQVWGLRGQVACIVNKIYKCQVGQTNTYNTSCQGEALVPSESPARAQATASESAGFASPQVRYADESPARAQAPASPQASPKPRQSTRQSKPRASQKVAVRAGGSGKKTTIYNGRSYQVLTGPRGGTFIVVNGKKRYEVGHLAACKGS
jgi:hypothetical protein